MPERPHLDIALDLLRPSGLRAFFDATSFMAPVNPIGRPRPGAPRRPAVDFRAGDLFVGSFLRRTYRGEEHIVYVVPPPDGAPTTWKKRGWGRYVYRGERHKTLTTIARRIVGSADEHVSGDRFFGLRRKRDEWLDLGSWQPFVVAARKRRARRRLLDMRLARLLSGQVLLRT